MFRLSLELTRDVGGDIPLALLAFGGFPPSRLSEWNESLGFNEEELFDVLTFLECRLRTADFGFMDFLQTIVFSGEERRLRKLKHK